MRLDKYLKVSRIFKRRTVAKEVSKSQKITVNGRPAKPSTNVEAGDILNIKFGSKELEIEILEVSSYAKKENAENMYKILKDAKLE